MVYEEPHKSHDKSEIVIKITPRNLERLIYIILIIGLLTFSILAARSKQCETVEDTVLTETVNEVTVEVEEEEVVVEEVVVAEVEEEVVTTKALSGKIEFELVSTSACIIDDNHGRLKTVKVKIYNGLTGPIQTMVDLYVWNEDETLDMTEDKIPSITNIYTIPSGITYTLPASIKSGIFIDIDEEKKVKAVIKYSDGSEISSSRLKIIGDTLQNVKARGDC